MPDPDHSAVIWRNTRKISAAVIGVRARFPCNRNAIDLGIGPGSRLHGICKHIHEHICCGLLKHLVRYADVLCVKNHPAFAIYNARKGKGLQVFPHIPNRSICCRHFNRGDPRCAQRKARPRFIYTAGIHTKVYKILSCNLCCNRFHQHARSRNIQRGHQAAPQRYKANILRAANARIARFRIPSFNRLRQVRHDRCRRQAKIKRRAIHG